MPYRFGLILAELGHVKAFGPQSHSARPDRDGVKAHPSLLSLPSAHSVAAHGVEFTVRAHPDDDRAVTSIACRRAVGRRPDTSKASVAQKRHTRFRIEQMDVACIRHDPPS